MVKYQTIIFLKDDKIKNKKLLIMRQSGHAKVILDTLSLHKKNIIAVLIKKSL